MSIVISNGLRTLFQEQEYWRQIPTVERSLRSRAMGRPWKAGCTDQKASKGRLHTLQLHSHIAHCGPESPDRSLPGAAVAGARGMRASKTDRYNALHGPNEANITK